MERIFEKDQYISGSLYDFAVRDTTGSLENWYRNAESICPQCERKFKSENSYRIENKQVAFFRELYYKCQCPDHIWVYAEENDNNQYVNHEGILHTIGTARGNYQSNILVRVPSDTIQFVYEQLGCYDIRTRTNFNDRFYQMLIILSNNIQELLLITPDKVPNQSENDSDHTGLHTSMGVLAGWSSRIFWRRYRQLLVGDSIRIICNIVDTESGHNDFNLTTLRKNKGIKLIDDLICNFKENKGQKKGKYHVIRANRNKDFIHTDHDVEWEEFPFSLLKECCIDIINAANALNEHIGHDFNIPHIELYTPSDSYNRIISLFEELEYSFYSKRRK